MTFEEDVETPIRQQAKNDIAAGDDTLARFVAEYDAQRALVRQADEAIAYLLDRIARDPRVAYHFILTESLARLVAAHAAVNGLDAAALKRKYNEEIDGEAPLCRACREPAT